MSDTLLILDRVEIVPETLGARPLVTRSLTEKVTKVSAQSVELLAGNLADFVAGLQTMIAKAAAAKGEFQLDTVEVAASITAEGQLALLGNGLGVSGTTGLTLTFKRIG